MYPDETICIVDNGLFVEIAVTLAESFGRTFYFSPWESAFPKRSDMEIGEGFKSVTRCNDYHEIIDEVDCWIFPDVYYAGAQKHLRNLGVPVWGSGRGEDLELKRIDTKEMMQKLGIPIGPWKAVVGMEALREHLKKNPDRWVKVPTRGDGETFYSPNYPYIEAQLDEIESTLGRRKADTKFIVEEPIKDAVELAIDSHTIDAQLPDTVLVGLENKGKAYIGKFMSIADVPPALLLPHEKLAPYLEEVQYRNWLALETRIDRKKKGWVIDPCGRAGSPPFEGIQRAVTNLPEIIREGAEGNLVEPEYAGLWVVQLILQSDWTEKHELVVQFPEKLRPNVKLKNGAFVRGQYCLIPQGYRVTAGAIVECGDDLDATIKKVEKMAAEVKGCYLDVFEDALKETKKELEKAAEFGVHF